MKTNTKVQMRPFDVHIPNLEGDGVAEIVQIQIPVRIDSETGEEILTAEAHDLIEKTKLRRMGLMSPEEIKGLRERLDLTQEEMSQLLQLGGKSYTRWESGRARPSRSLNILLCALRDGVVTTEYLRALRHGGTTEVLAERLLAPDQWAKSQAGAHAWVYFESSDLPQCWSEASIELRARETAGRGDFFQKLMRRIEQTSPETHSRQTAIVPDRLSGSRFQHRWKYADMETDEKATP